MISRQAITTALATVPGIDAKEYVPDVVEDLTAWPVLKGYRPLESMACLILEPRWQAIVTMTRGTRPDAAEAAETLGQLVADALYGARLPVELIELVDVQVAPGATDTVPGLRFTLTD